MILEDFDAQSLKIWQQQRTFTLQELLRFAIRHRDFGTHSSAKYHS
jgi:hypothetical protein